MSPDKTGSHKSRRQAFSTDITTVCQHMKSILEVKSITFIKISPGNIT